jgi:hypothetical protein
MRRRIDTEFTPGMSELGKSILAAKRQRAAYSILSYPKIFWVHTAIINALARKGS